MVAVKSAVLRLTFPLTVVELLAPFWDFAEQYYQKDGKPTKEIKILRCAGDCWPLASAAAPSVGVGGVGEVARVEGSGAAETA